MITMAISMRAFLIFGFIATSMGVHLYDPITQMCCQGQVHELQPAEDGLDPLNAFCCGDAAYDLRTSICCSGRVLPRNHSAISCCGSAAYDVTANLCCGGTVVAISSSVGSEDLDGGSGDTLNGVDNEMTLEEDLLAVADNATTIGFYHVPMLCCDQDAYDWRTDMCCTDGVRKRPYPHAECCGTTAYDISRQVCCGSTVHQEEGDVSLFCCDQQAYDSSVQLCCDKQLHTKPNVTATYLCCGDQLMDPSSQDCCGGTVVASSNGTATCCGKVAFDPETQLCCDGAVHDIAAEGMPVKCCGTATYGPEEVCCDGTVHKEQLPCCGTSLLADAERDMCCNKQVVPRRTTHTRCCGSATYEHDRQLCCQGNSVGRGSAMEACCGDRVFDADLQVCCYEGAFHVLDKNGSQTTCCSRLSDDDEAN